MRGKKNEAFKNNTISTLKHVGKRETCFKKKSSGSLLKFWIWGTDPQGNDPKHPAKGVDSNNSLNISETPCQIIMEVLRASLEKGHYKKDFQPQESGAKARS